LMSGRRGDQEPTGEAESIIGRIDPKEMGSRVVREDLKLEEKKKKAEKEKAKREKREGNAASSKRKLPGQSGTRYGDVLEATQDLEGLDYRPRTAETRAVYELMLASVHSLLGDTPPAMVRSAADMILSYLKDDELKDLDKKREIDSLVSSNVPNDTFAQLVSLGKKITDYGEDEDAAGKAGDEGMDMDESKIDDDVGVAVVFDEDEDEEDEDGAGFEIRDSDDDDDEDEETATGNVEEEDEMVTGSDLKNDEGEDENLVIGENGSTTTTSKSTSTSGTVPAREIDGFWLQRLVAQSYPDPLEAAEKTQSAMTLLSSDANKRDVENSLMDLTEYDKFELVSTLVNNREKIVWCTKLARSNEDEKIDVEVAMREKGVGWILKELRGDVVKPARGPGGGDITMLDEPDKSTLKGTLAPGSSAPPPRKVLDLESMAFAQGGRLMSNKKCKLPEGSFKRSKKGYEEVHVPAPKPAPLKDGELVPVTSMPEWARDAFKGNPNLNRVQSRLYPVAFGTDEPLLLCAPTGAGKVSLLYSALFLTLTDEITFCRPMSPC
jgi:pre-mRNA-splicing helicase BRR2